MSLQEGVQTRWNSCPTVALLLVNRISNWSRSHADMRLASGDACKPQRERFEFATAQAIHRNLVRVPRWSVGDYLSNTDRHGGREAVQQYVTGEFLPCKVVEGKLLLIPGGDDCGLTYRDDLGVVIPTRHTRPTDNRAQQEDDSESYD